jgi:hypothetical protein
MLAVMVAVLLRGDRRERNLRIATLDVAGAPT